MDIKRAVELVNPSDGIREHRSATIKKQAWDLLFKEYNTMHEQKLGTNCMPCFGKVYLFMKKRSTMIPVVPGVADPELNIPTPNK